MAKRNVLVAYPIPEAGMKLLRQKFNVTVSKKKLAASELRKKAQGHEGIVSLLTDKIDTDFLRANPQVKIIANYAVGFDNIDVEAVKKAGADASNTPGVLTNAVGEHAIALMMAVGRRIVEADRFLRAGKYKGWEPELLLGTGFAGKTLGIVGLGRIGSYVTHIAKRGLGMEVVYNDVKPNPEFEKEYGATFMKLPQLLKVCDVVSIHVPLLPQTHHLFSHAQFKAMKKTAIVINTSRGPVIDESALVGALEQGVIGGAGLDVFEQEPKLAPGLAKLWNCVITPHIASATHEARDAMAVIVAQNIMDVLINGKKARNSIVK